MNLRKVKIELNNKVIKTDFEVPSFWSDRAALIMASKYAMDSENSALDVVDRVVNQITKWGKEQGYFKGNTGYDRLENILPEVFTEELRNILINQQASFNSPVWFNCGVPNGTNQMSACYILSVEDSMVDILEHVKREGLIFRGGSGAGVNVSKLRATGEKLSNKGSTSGPLSFMKVWDANAESIKSGGKNRRSAKLVCMDADHPDIMKFIECKQHEENKAKILLANGISPEEAYSTVAFQNTNHSIRVTDKFMEAVLKDGDWHLVNRGDKKKKKVKAKEILMRVAEVAWATGDPGIQFDDRMNKDNPVPSIGKINSTNPCSEFSAVDESSCDLASLNLMSFLRDGEINYEEMERVINLLVMAMDILIDAASYPTEKIREVTTSTRPLGLGFTNLGTLLISLGIPYGSPEGTSLAAAITKFITTAAYKKSIKLAAKHGSFKAFEENKNACMQIAKRLTDGNSDVCSGILEHGLRNSQLTLLAPTGTISFIMDAETTGLEPLFAHKMTKSLSGGGVMNIQATCINSLLIENDIDTTVRKELWPENIKKIAATANEISWEDHINMVAACQNYLNGAISKTINMPNSCKVEDIFDAYIYAWRQGLKAISIYRDGSKFMQPLQENKKKEEDKEIIAITKETKWIPVRKKLPDTCYGPQHKFNIGGFKGYIKVGTYEDGSPGQVFITASKSGSTMQGLLDSFATAISIGLQYGVPVEKFIEKFVGSQYSPSGYTQNENIRFTSSIVDYIFRWLQIEFFDEEENDHIEIKNNEPPAPLVKVILDGPNCTSCGGLTQRNGTCFVCTTCGATTGCS